MTFTASAERVPVAATPTPRFRRNCRRAAAWNRQGNAEAAGQCGGRSCDSFGRCAGPSRENCNRSDGAAFAVWLAGGGFKAGHVHGITDELGYKVVANRVTVPDLHATVLHQLGLDHRKLSFLHAGREETLTDSLVTGAHVIDDLLRA